MSVAYLTQTATLVVAREDGVLRRRRATPLPSWGYFAGRIGAAMLIADAAALILVLVGVAMAVLHLSGAGVVSLLIAATLGGLALAAAGTAITPLLTSAQGVNQLMSYLAAQPMIDAVTRALGPGAGMPGRDLAVLAARAVGCLLLSVRFFTWDPRRPRHARAAGRP